MYILLYSILLCVYYIIYKKMKKIYSIPENYYKNEYTFTYSPLKKNIYYH